MRFSPHRTIPNSSLDDIDPGYDSLSDDEYTEEGPMGLIDSSPLKSILTPSKTPTNKHLGRKEFRKTYNVYNSSPLAKSDQSYTSSKYNVPPSQYEEATAIADETTDNNTESIDDLSELLQNMEFKERYLIAMESSQFNSRFNSSRPGSRHSSRPTSARHTRRPSLVEPSSSPVLGQTKSSHLNFADNKVTSSPESAKSQDTSFFQKRQDNIIGDLQSRSTRRSKEVENQIKAIEAERKRQEEERKRREEEERKRLEDERKKKEEAERKMKEEEERMRREAEKKAKLEAEKLAKEKAEQEEKQAQEKKKREEEAIKEKKLQEERESQKGIGRTNYAEVEKQFLQHKELIQTIKTDIVTKVKSDLQTKNAVLKHKRKINPKFGQLTNSLPQLSRISNEVVVLIRETESNELAFKWILNFVAKAIVAQAETEVRAHASSSLPLGKLALNLLVEFPQLKEFLLTRFIKKCPFVIGYTCAIHTEEGRLRMGWKRHDDDKWEDEVSYDERMTGMMTLYGVITRLPLDPKYFNNVEHPLPIANSWVMLARLVNQPKNLLTNAHFITISSWWEAAAKELVEAYGKQGVKMLNLLWTSWAQSVDDKGFAGAKTLQTIGEDWIQTGKIKQFDEMEP